MTVDSGVTFNVFIAGKFVDLVVLTEEIALKPNWLTKNVFFTLQRTKNPTDNIIVR